MDAYPGSLGSPICSDTAVCQDAENAVTQMDSVFQSAPTTVQAQYQSAHDSIMAAYQQNYGMLTNWIPFNPQCCTLQTIGQQAFDLMNQIQVAMGQNPTPGFSGTNLTTYLIIGAAIYLGLVYFASHK